MAEKVKSRMLKKENRLRGKNNFALMREKGRLIQSPLFGLVILEGEDKRFGIVVSKKISKIAVERNRIRRRIYEGVKKKWEIIPKNVWGLFLVKKEILEMDTMQIEKEVERLFKEIR